MFDEKPSDSPVSGIQQPPKGCLVAGCRGEADVLVLVVREKSGRVVSGAASDFCYLKKESTVLKNGYTFMHWVARCCACYDRDLRRAGHQALKLLPAQERAA